MHELKIYSTYLKLGQMFEGTQSVVHKEASGFSVPRHHQSRSKTDSWKVCAQIEAIDLENATISGSMEAMNAPSSQSRVVTYWEGEIIDNKHHFFYTKKWDAKECDDYDHWSRLLSFLPFREPFNVNGAIDVDITSHPFIFMRWKEKRFINVGSDCGLTIAGFYYISFCRQSGDIEGYYFDPNSSPYQKLSLKGYNYALTGHSTSSFELL